MSEWWTYTLSDFLLFSSRTYYRLFEIYNAAIRPAQLAALAVAIAIPLLLRRRLAGSSRAIAALLAAAWLWVALAFLAARYATINWAAVYFAWAFGAEAALLLWSGAVRRSLQFGWPETGAARLGLAIYLAAFLILPVVGPLLGRGWRGVQLFGLTPDPTAVATLGLLLLARGRGRALSMIVPVLWCAITGATLLAMKSAEWWIAPLAAAIVVAVAGIGRARPDQRRHLRSHPDLH